MLDSRGLADVDAARLPPRGDLPELLRRLRLCENTQLRDAHRRKFTGDPVAPDAGLAHRSEAAGVTRRGFSPANTEPDAVTGPAQRRAPLDP
jgi:hypothetical protein